jgi:hypothetical protein
VTTGSSSLEPLPYATTDVGIFGESAAMRPVRVQGPSTGLPWGVEQVRLNCLASAANHDRLAASYAGSSEFGVGLCQGTADGYRRAAEDLIRYATWRAL